MFGLPIFRTKTTLELVLACTNSFVPDVADQVIFNILMTLPAGECHELVYNNVGYDPSEWVANYMPITLNGTIIAEVEYTPSREGTPFSYNITSGGSVSSYSAVFTDFFTTFTEVELDPP